MTEDTTADARSQVEYMLAMDPRAKMFGVKADVLRAILARAEKAEAEWGEALTLANRAADSMRKSAEIRLALVAERDALQAEVARLRGALEPFAYALKSARSRSGEMPHQADVTAIACRFIAYEHLKDALSEIAQSEARP